MFKQMWTKLYNEKWKGGLVLCVNTCFFGQFFQSNWIFFMLMHISCTVYGHILFHSSEHKVAIKSHTFDHGSVEAFSWNIAFSTAISNQRATSYNQPLDLWANLPSVIYYFSRGANILPVCVWLFTVRVGCLLCLSRRNVCSQNGVRINKQLFL